MNNKLLTRVSEQGQTIVIFALSLVFILGFVALALDGGMLLSDRRHAQNAADASALAGATAAAIYMKNNDLSSSSFYCGASYVLPVIQTAQDAAISRAGSNDYQLDGDISDNHGVSIICGVEDQGYRVLKYLDVVVEITRDTPSNFAHLIYPGELKNEVRAISRVYPPGPIGYGYAIISLNDQNCSGNQNGIIMGGSMSGFVTGSEGIFSNGCIKGDGSSFSFTVDEGGIVGYAVESSGTMTNFNPPPKFSPNKIGLFALYVPAPDCSGLKNKTAPFTGDKTISPGNYAQIKRTGGNLIMQPGLYCITGKKGIELLGGSISGEGVTIYLQTGGMNVGGNMSNIYLAAPKEDPDPAPAIPGMLVFLAEGNGNTIILNGNSQSTYVGTIYALDGNVKINGSSGTGGDVIFNTQIVANNVQIDGDATLKFPFNAEEQSEKPPYLELLE